MSENFKPKKAVGFDNIITNFKLQTKLNGSQQFGFFSEFE